MFRRKDEATANEATVTNETTPSTSSATPASNTSGTSSPAANSGPAPTVAAPVGVAAPAAPAASPYQPQAARPAAAAASPYRAPAGNTAPAAAPASESKSSRRILTVGNDILLKGEIATCDRLVIEGKVEATLNNVHTVEIAESGSFKGSAEIEDAEISGLFEGDLVVRNRLVIYSTGKVRGKISFGEIEIERGGELTGEISLFKGEKSKKEAA
jgi:cytoskeletal protein CcmA (bactofilin family)